MGTERMNNNDVTLTIENRTATNGEAQIRSETSEPEPGLVNTNDTYPSLRRRIMNLRIKDRTRSYCDDLCSTKTLKRKLPITKWLPKYNLRQLRNDVLAGFTVGLTVIPQGLAYAALAGLELQYGLYSAFIGCFVYFFLGTSKDITLGPTAIMSLLVAEYASDPWTDGEVESNASLAILLSFFSGIFLIVLGILRLGAIVRFISHPVISGFTSAAAFVIAGSQLKKILGVKVASGSKSFFPNIIATFRNISDTRVYDLVLGICCVVILLALKIAKDKIVEPKDREIPLWKKILYKTLWFMSTARNAIIVLVASIISYALIDLSTPVEERVFTLTKKIPPGLPEFRAPNFTFEIPGSNETVPFSEMMAKLGSGLAVIPLMALLESIAIATAFGRKNNYKIDATQELMALGVANLLGAFLGSYPVTGSFSRTAVNSQSNVATPAGGILTGVLVIIALAFLSSAFQYIPTSALAAVIVMAVINMFDYQSFKRIARVNWPDLLPLVLTFGLCFWDLAYGIIAGIALSLLMLLIPHAMPNISHHLADGKSVTVKISRGLDFAAAEYFEHKIYNIASKDGIETVYLDCSRITSLDYSAVEAFSFCYKEFQKKKIILVICGLEVKLQEKLKKRKLLEGDFLKYQTCDKLQKCDESLNENEISNLTTV